MLRRLLSRISLLLIGCLLVSCSQTKLAYGFLDNWLRWELQSYFTLSGDQKRQLKTLSKEFHDWHRHNELTELSNFAAETAELLSQPQITPQQVEQTFDQVDTLYQRSAIQLRSISDALLPTLNQSQVDEILGRIDEQIQEYQEKYLAVSADERIQNRADETVEFFSSILGKFNDEQKQLILEWSHAFDDLSPEHMLKQLQWREAFKKHINTDRSDPNNLDSLAELIFEEMAPLNTQYQQRDQANQERSRAMIVTLHQSLSDKQRDRMQKKLARYQQDFIELAQKAPQSK